VGQAGLDVHRRVFHVKPREVVAYIARHLADLGIVESDADPDARPAASNLVAEILDVVLTAHVVPDDLLFLSVTHI
jgi:hypothetical protein